MQHRLANDNRLTRDENPEDHFCVFFVPIDVQKDRIFMGHHKKANDWIPPGGHIDLGEDLHEAVVREMQEELSYRYPASKLILFNCSVKDVTNTANACRIHHDIWYIARMHETSFNFTKEEYYDARWMDLDRAIQKCNLDTYKSILRSLYGRPYKNPPVHKK